MKKSLAVFGASAMGLGLVGAGAAVPAVAAAPVESTGACDNFSAQVAATGELTESWYQSCVPQYGAGKAEFTIVASEDDPAAEFPEGFVPLDELTDTRTTTADTDALQDYYDIDPNGFSTEYPVLATELLPGGDATTQHYVATVVAPINTISSLDLESVPEAAASCLVGESIYDGGWSATFDTVDTTYSQTIDGEDWNFIVEVTPLTTYFFGAFGGEFGVGPWCITDGTRTETSENALRNGNELFERASFGPLDFDLFGTTGAFANLGTFYRDVPVIPEPEVPEPEVPNPEVPEPEVPNPEVPEPEVPNPEIPNPEIPNPVDPETPVAPPAAVPATPATPATLPALGADVVPLAIAAGAFTAFGLALLGFVKFAGRRRPRV